MKLAISFGRNCCDSKVFIINGKKAEIEHFGELVDVSGQPDWGCAEQIFSSKPSQPNILTHYNISSQEYETICEKLLQKVHFEECCYCE